MAAPLYPLFLRLEERRVLVIGAGEVATRRIERLIASGARVTVIAPAASDTIRGLAADGALEWQDSEWAGEIPAATFLCIAATSDPLVNGDITLAAERAGVLAVDATDATRGSANVPAVVTHEQVCVAVSTSGSSPALTRLLATKIEQMLGPETDELAELLSRLRAIVGSARTQRERAGLYRAIATDESLAQLRSGARDTVLEKIRREASARGFGEVVID